VYEKQSAEYLADPVAGAGSWADLGVRSGVARAEQYGRRVQTRFAAVGAGLKIFKVSPRRTKETASHTRPFAC
jgi:plasmid stabilization system protein ParE